MKRALSMPTITVLFIIFSLVLIFPSNDPAFGADTRIIRIYSSISPDGPIRLEPENLYIEPGTTVIGNNWARDGAAIRFDKGTKCDKATMAVFGFVYDEEKVCVVTRQDVTYGGTASMMFEGTGTFDYVVELTGKKKKAKGSIVVQHFEED